MTGAATVPLGVSHRSRLVEVYVRHAPEGIRLAYLLTGEWPPRPGAFQRLTLVDH